jgi:hypothetical protein
MADQKAKDERLADPTSAQTDATPEDDDTEGHLMMPNISSARAITNERSTTAERNMRVRVHQKDDRPADKRQR